MSRSAFNSLKSRHNENWSLGGYGKNSSFARNLKPCVSRPPAAPTPGLNLDKTTQILPKIAPKTTKKRLNFTFCSTCGLSPRQNPMPSNSPFPAPETCQAHFLHLPAEFPRPFFTLQVERLCTNAHRLSPVPQSLSTWKDPEGAEAGYPQGVVEPPEKSVRNSWPLAPVRWFPPGIKGNTTVRLALFTLNCFRTQSFQAESITI